MNELTVLEEDILQAVERKLRSSNLKILSFSQKFLEEKFGLVGEHAYLEASALDSQTNTEQRLSFFVKYFPQNRALAIFAEEAGSFEKEQFVYECFSKFRDEGIDIISSCTPGCYLTKRRQYFLFDNLKEEGFEMMSKHQYLDEVTLLSVLHSLAEMHASSIIFEEKKTRQSDKEYRLIDDNEDSLKDSFFTDSNGDLSKRTVENTLKCILSEFELFEFSDELLNGRSFKQTLTALYGKILDMVGPSKTRRNVLCHGDLWSTNFLVKRNKNGKAVACKFVDFQSARYCPPSHDVLALIHLTTSRDFRNKFMYQMIGMYYSYLEKHVKMAGFSLTDIIPFGNFMESCEEQKVFAILQTAMYFPLILVDYKYFDKYFESEEDCNRIFAEDRFQLVREYKDKDDLYCTRLKESIEDLKEQCEIFRE